MINILLINQPVNNRGDEAAHRALVRTLIKRLPEAKITVLFFWEEQKTLDQYIVDSPNVQYVNYRNPHFAWGKALKAGIEYGMYFMWSLHPTTRGLLRYYKECDWVLSAPGGISMGGFQNWQHLLMLYFAKYCRKPIAYYGRSFGPFPEETCSQRKYKRMSYSILKYFSFLSIRDAYTEKLAEKIGLNYISTVDTAFLEQPRVQLPLEAKKLLGNNPFIVFVPNLLIWHYNFHNRLTKEMVVEYFSQMCNILLDQYPEHQVVMLPQTFNYGNYLGDDFYFFNDVKDCVDNNRVIVMSDQYGSDIQQTIISKASIVVGARYHSVVFALNNNVPFVALSYEHKIAGLLKTLGKQNSMIDITHAMDDEESVKKSLQEFRERLMIARSDQQVQRIAVQKANNCMNSFINIIDG